MPSLAHVHSVRPVKVLHGIPNHLTYRMKLEQKWRRKGYSVRFA